MKNLFALSLILILGGCQDYLVRSDLIDQNAGDAVARNASNQTIDPWPIYVYDTNIKTSSQRQSDAVKKYNTIHQEETASSGSIQLIPAASPSTGSPASSGQ